MTLTYARTESFEWLRTEIDRHPHASTGGDRDLIWADTAHTVAVSRDDKGTIEIFLVGDPIEPATRVLRDLLEHQTWTTRGGGALAANRMALPESSNLPGVAAFICAELLANGFGRERQPAFSRTEPVIAALFAQQQLGSEVLTGLVGELILLDELTRQSSAPDEVVACWFGSVPSSRDVQLGEVGVEVKATTGATASHLIQGFHQVELGHPVEGVPETALYLFSVGVRWLPPAAVGGTSVPELVDAIAERLSTSDREQFITRVRQYGGDIGVGYDHTADRNRPRYAKRLMGAFERLYDMKDERIRVLQSSDVAGIPHIEHDSVTFRIALPTQINGDLNPTTDLVRAASKVLEEAGFARR
ncbi:PD-(D/E)XK motif protein [Promicromonospora sukumoe]|uniref:PD-(D/E)XK motif protein n=1 Tax=Promicromonospora sukumoe TaxID=88382 RepID=UPI00037CCCD0|nr:PD-(D/E)XK motif protein [Promicromonospora sukumoe]